MSHLLIQFLTKKKNHAVVLSLPFTEPECPPLSENLGRCGPSWGGRCNKNLADYAVYCNEENGWCGVTSAHKYAQSSDLYDWEPESCKRNEFLHLISFHRSLKENFRNILTI